MNHTDDAAINHSVDYLPVMTTNSSTLNFVASAPGKVILFGEHSVVYGQPAIAAALSDLRIFVHIAVDTTTVAAERTIRICMPDLPQRLDVMFPVDIFVTSILIPQQQSSRLLCPPSPQCTKLLESFIQQQLGPSDSRIDEHAIHAILPVLYLLAQLGPSQPDSGSIIITVRSKNLPVGAGLGSSAAFGVACTAAFIQWKYWNIHASSSGSDDAGGETVCDIQMKDNHKQVTMTEEMIEEINMYAYYSEMLLHGRPSGIDNTVSTYGGIISFTRKSHHEVSFHRIGKAKLPLEDKNCNATDTSNNDDNSLLQNQYHLILVDTHVPRQTKQLVGAVRQLYDAYPSIITPILDAMGQIAVTFCNIITKSSTNAVDDTIMDDNATRHQTNDDEVLSLVRMNQSLLCSLGVSHPSIDRVCGIINNKHTECNTNQATMRRISQYAAAKLTGAGGGGCIMILLNRLPSSRNDESLPTIPELQHDIISTLRSNLDGDDSDEKQRYTFLSSTVGGDGVLFVPYSEYETLFHV